MYSFQELVRQWCYWCFGAEITDNKEERAHRFLEEALELFQSCERPQEEAEILVKYVYGRPTGKMTQEVGGVMVTLAALCNANNISMDKAGEVELQRVWDNIEKIRTKQAAKPKNISTAARALPSS